ncbi:MAG: biotin transporter BioY [Gemmatimonadota bacterium]
MSIERREVSVWTRLEAVGTPRARRIVGIVTFAVLTALGAKLAVPIPGTAVPFTLQPLAVILTGALLGARLGAASQTLYLLAGVAGLPVFAAGAGAAYLLGPTGGYLLAYPVAAFVVGAIAGGGALRTLVAMLAGLGAIYVGGVAWLTILGGFSAAVALGLLPFIAADLVKVVMATVVSLRVRDRSLELFGG